MSMKNRGPRIAAGVLAYAMMSMGTAYMAYDMGVKEPYWHLVRWYAAVFGCFGLFGVVVMFTAGAFND